MKVFLFLAVVFSAFTFSSTDEDITGVWQIMLPNNVTGTINYRKDSTFVTSVNNKNFTSGKYLYKDKVMTFIEDNGCQYKNGAYMIGAYKINFIASDSIQFDLVYDSCGGRRRDLNHLKLGRPQKRTGE